MMALTDPLSGWGELTLALAVFLATHVIPSRPAVRARLVAVAGMLAYIIAYSLISLVVLGWLIRSAADAPFVELWAFADWQRLFPQVGMLLACVLGVFGLTSPNPLSIGRKRGPAFDPEHPGVVGVVRHPVLWALLVWSATHLVPNGDLAHLVLFGLFAAFSAAGMLLLDRRARRRLGEAEWVRLSRHTSNLPFAALRDGWTPSLRAASLGRLAIAMALYLLLLTTHPLFAGIPAIAP